MRIPMRHIPAFLVCLVGATPGVSPARAQEAGAPQTGGMGQQHRMHEGGGEAGMQAGMQGGGMLGGISQAEKEALRSGAGLGAGRLAMMNGYPGPKHVLEMADELELTAAQKESIGKIFAEAKASFAQMGARLVEKEEALEAMFASGSVDVKDVEKRAKEIGELQGALRAGHLNAHVRTKQELSPAQLEKLSSGMGAHGAMGGGTGQGQGEGMQHRHGREGGAGEDTAKPQT